MRFRGIVHPVDEKVKDLNRKEVSVMSERTVNENNKLWEAAEKIAEEAVAAKKAASEEERRKQKKRVVKIVLLMILIALIIVFASIAWFAMNKAVSADTMAIEANSGVSYTIQPIGNKAGIYDEYIDNLGVDTIKWTLSSDDNMENWYKKSGQPSSSEMAEITRLDSEEYGLKPGDHGSLKFRVTSVSTDDILVSFDISCIGYSATFDSYNYKTDDDLEEVTDTAVNNYLSSHILFFYKDDSDNLHLLTSDGFSKTIGAGQSEDITIYWLWPATLKEILDENITGLSDSGAAKEVKRYFFENPGYFLKPIGGETFSDITVEKQADVAAEDAAIEEKMALVSGKNYNQYGSKYNDADQAIGDHINYILVELDSGVSSGD